MNRPPVTITASTCRTSRRMLLCDAGAVDDRVAGTEMKWLPVTAAGSRYWTSRWTLPFSMPALWVAALQAWA